jgi:hypothetical protein
MVYFVTCVIGDEVWEPPEVPVQVSPLPVTVQETGFVVDQEMVVLLPDATRRGLRILVSTCELTDTVTKLAAPIEGARR